MELTPNRRAARSAITPTRSGLRTFAYSQPLRLDERGGQVYLVEPETLGGPGGQWVTPLDDRDLANRFLALDGSAEAFVEFFQPIGHPLAGRKRPLTFDVVHAFGLAQHIPVSTLETFRAELQTYVSVLSAIESNPKLAKDYVKELPTGRGWRFEKKFERHSLRRALLADDERTRWVKAKLFDERPFLACHIFLNEILQGLIADRFRLRAQVARSAPFQVGHPIHYEPEDVLGAILLQVIEGLAVGQQLGHCAVCTRPFIGNRKRRTCSDRCRTAASRRARAAEGRESVQQ